MKQFLLALAFILALPLFAIRLQQSGRAPSTVVAYACADASQAGNECVAMKHNPSHPGSRPAHPRSADTTTQGVGIIMLLVFLLLTMRR